jgi:hypothetical protein
VAGIPPHGMPRSFYDLGWLQNLDEWEYSNLNVQDPMDLSLSHPPLMQMFLPRFHPTSLTPFHLELRLVFTT